MKTYLLYDGATPGQSGVRLIKQALDWLIHAGKK